MRKLAIIIISVLLLTTNVSAAEYTAPDAPKEAQEFLPFESASFGEDLWYVIRTAIKSVEPSFAEALKIGVSLISVVLIVSITQVFTGISTQAVHLTTVLAISALLLRSSQTMINCGLETVNSLADYGKLLLPVISGAMAAQGGVNSSVSLYTGTVIFSTVLILLISKVLVPMIYIYITLRIANNTFTDTPLKSLSDSIKWLMTWSLKIVLYVYTGYMGITGVVSGATDVSLMKATKLAISGMVPVVGGIISDASESIIVGTGVMKTAAGTYGLLVLLALCVGPFFKVGVHYLILKLAAGICAAFGVKQPVKLIADFSVILGFILAMIGAICLMFLISTVCFMKGFT